MPSLFHVPFFSLSCALFAPRAGRVDGVSRATSGTLFKIAHPRERATFCGCRRGFLSLLASRAVDRRFSWRISLFGGEIFRRRITHGARGFAFSHRGDTLIDLSMLATNSKTNVPSPFFFSRNNMILNIP